MSPRRVRLYAARVYNVAMCTLVLPHRSNIAGAQLRTCIGCLRVFPLRTVAPLSLRGFDKEASESRRGGRVHHIAANRTTARAHTRPPLPPPSVSRPAEWSEQLPQAAPTR